MQKALVVLCALAALFAANLCANAVAITGTLGTAPGFAERNPGAARQVMPPILSRAGPRVPVVVRGRAPALSRITPVRKQPGTAFAPTAQDWAEYMHDSSHSCMIDGNAASKLVEAWTYVTPGGGQTAFGGSPVESDGIICFTSSDGYLYAIDRASGGTAWAPVLLGASGYRGGTPVIWQDRVVTEMYTGTGATSSIFCRSMATGESLWTVAIPTGTNVWNVYLSRPIVLAVNDTGYVFVPVWSGSAKPFTARILGLNMITGAIKYDQQWAGNRIIGGLATDGTDLYAPLLTTGVVKLHPGNGPAFDSIWAQSPTPPDTEPNGVYSSAVYCNGQVFAAKGGTSGPESLYAINAGTGVVNWCKLVGTSALGIDLGSPAVDSAHVYMYASNFTTSPYYSMVMSFNQTDGSHAWTNYYQTTDGMCDGALAVTTGAKKRLYLATGFGSTAYGHVLALDAVAGTLQQDLPYPTDYLYNSICRPFGGLYTLTYGSYAAGTLVGYTLNDGPPSPADVGVSAITSPRARFLPATPLTPHCIVRNYGTMPQSGIPVTCQIDSAGMPVYTGMGTVSGPVSPGDTGSASLSPDWTPGPGLTYDVTMFTSLSGDTCLGNDSAAFTAWEAWAPVAHCPAISDRIDHALVYDPVNDKIFMMGGNPAGVQGTYVTTNYRYDPETDSWTARRAMPAARGWEPGAYCRGKIYYLGGHTNSNTVDSMNYRYNIATDSWATGARVPHLRLADMEVVWRDSLIYCLGGWDGTSAGDDSFVDIYDPFGDTWLTGTNLPTGAEMGGAAIIGDTIYIADAYGRDIYTCWPNLYKGYIDPSDPTSITWIQGPSFDGNATCVTGAAALGNRVYWFGGFVGVVTPSAAGWYYDNTTGLISSYLPYMGAICRNQWICARTNAPYGIGNGLYGICGDSGCNWNGPNRGCYKLMIPVASVGVSEARSGENPVPTDLLVVVAPNPVGGRALVRYSLSRAGLVSLKLYDVTGQLVSTLASGYHPAGSYSALLRAGRGNLARGVYLLKCESGGYRTTEKLVIE